MDKAETVTTSKCPEKSGGNSSSNSENCNPMSKSSEKHNSSKSYHGKNYTSNYNKPASTSLRDRTNFVQYNRSDHYSSSNNNGYRSAIGRRDRYQNRHYNQPYYQRNRNNSYSNRGYHWNRQSTMTDYYQRSVYNHPTYDYPDTYYSNAAQLSGVMISRIMF